MFCMSGPTEDLGRLSEEVRRIADEISGMKDRDAVLESGPEKKLLRQKIKEKQWQALFYIEKLRNLGVKQGAGR